MKLSDAKAKGIIKRIIDLSEHFHEAAGTAWIILREPSKNEAIELSEIQKTAGWEKIFFDKMEDYIIDHSFVDTDKSGEEVKATNKAVIEMVLDSFTLTNVLAGEWLKTFPLARGSDSNLNNLPSSASTGPRLSLKS